MNVHHGRYGGVTDTTRTVRHSHVAGATVVFRGPAPDEFVEPLYVRVLAKVYGLNGDQTESLVALAKKAEERGWWSKQQTTLSAEHLEYIAFENEATMVRNYETSFVPGLLQTEAYARATATDTVRPPLPAEEIDNRVAIRMTRAKRLTDDNQIELWGIVDESALRRPTGGAEVMREQLAQLEALSRKPNVTLQVIPNEVGAHPGMSGAFHILSFADERVGDVVYVDTPVGEIYAEDDDQIQSCEVTFEHLRAVALSEQQSRTRIRRAAKELPQ